MSQVTPVEAPSAVPIVVAPVGPRSAADRAYVREVAEAVKAVNESGDAGQGKEVTFSIDKVSRLPVVKVIDITTREIVNQWPAEYVLHLAAGIKGNPEIQDESLL